MFIVFFTTRILNSFVVAIFSTEARDIDIVVCCLVPESSSKPIFPSISAHYVCINVPVGVASRIFFTCEI